MPVFGIVAVLALTALGSFIFSTLTYSLRNLSRVRLSDYAPSAHNRPSGWIKRSIAPIDLTLVTAILRMIFNTLLVLAGYALALKISYSTRAIYTIAAALACVVTFFCSVAFPHSLAAHASAEIVGLFVRPLHALRLALTPVMGLLRGIDNMVRNATGAEESTDAEEIEQEIMSVVEEGEKEGVVDEQEREMIESVIEFRDTTAGQIMTPRTQIVAIELDSTLEHVRQTIEESGHSRIPIFTGTIDQIVGVLYARDLLRFLGQTAFKFDMKTVMRPPLYVPESKPSRELLRDFRLQKIHIAIILDEYGGTAGLVTIEDILEQIVGDISDEHEPIEPAMFKRINETTCEVDAQIDIDELNRLTGLAIPEDAGYTTLGGYISTTLGSIPENGVSIEYNGLQLQCWTPNRRESTACEIDQPFASTGGRPAFMEAQI